MSVPEYLNDDLNWWQTHINSSVNPIRDDNLLLYGFFFLMPAKQGGGQHVVRIELTENGVKMKRLYT